MKVPVFVRVLVCTAFACLMLGLAMPAAAQAGKGGLKGTILTADGKGVDLAEVTLEFLGEPKIKAEKTLTDKNGAWEKRNLMEGRWSISVNAMVTRVQMTAKVPEVVITAGKVSAAPDIAVKPASEGGGGAVKTANAEEIKKEDETAKRYAEIKGTLASVDGDVAAGKFDDALAKLTDVAGKVENCAMCYAKMGEVNMKKGDDVAAEAAFKKATEMDPKMSEPWSGLASLYNNQRKFELAAQMSAKVNELAMAAGGAGDPNELYNQGVAFWNANKFPEAEATFKKVTELDPRKADAFFRLGMAQVNQGKNKEALASLEAYVKLAPTGADVETAKAVIAMIKK